MDKMSRPDFCPPSCAHQTPNKDLLRSRLPVVCPVGRPTAGYRVPAAPTRYLSTRNEATLLVVTVVMLESKRTMMRMMMMIHAMMMLMYAKALQNKTVRHIKRNAKQKRRRSARSCSCRLARPVDVEAKRRQGG